MISLHVVLVCFLRNCRVFLVKTLFQEPESARQPYQTLSDGIKPFSSCISRSQPCDKQRHWQHTSNYRPSSILGKENGALLEDGRLWERSVAAKGFAPRSHQKKRKGKKRDSFPTEVQITVSFFCYGVSKEAQAPF